MFAVSTYEWLMMFKYWYVTTSFKISRGFALKFSSHSKDILNSFRNFILNLAFQTRHYST